MNCETITSKVKLTIDVSSPPKKPSFDFFITTVLAFVLPKCQLMSLVPVHLLCIMLSTIILVSLELSVELRLPMHSIAVNSPMSLNGNHFLFVKCCLKCYVLLDVYMYIFQLVLFYDPEEET